MLFSIYEIGVTSIKLVIRSAVEGKDGHVQQHSRCHAYQFYLFISVYLYFISHSIIVKDPYTLHTLPMLYVMCFNPYPTAFPYGNGMVLPFYQQQESSTTKTVHKVINKGLKAYV